LLQVADDMAHRQKCVCLHGRDMILKALDDANRMAQAHSWRSRASLYQYPCTEFLPATQHAYESLQYDPVNANGLSRKLTDSSLAPTPGLSLSSTFQVQCLCSPRALCLRACLIGRNTFFHSRTMDCPPRGELDGMENTCVVRIWRGLIPRRPLKCFLSPTTKQGSAKQQDRVQAYQHGVQRTIRRPPVRRGNNDERTSHGQSTDKQPKQPILQLIRPGTITTTADNTDPLTPRTPLSQLQLHKPPRN